jgi:hypothetical protein
VDVDDLPGAIEGHDTGTVELCGEEAAAPLDSRLHARDGYAFQDRRL